MNANEHVVYEKDQPSSSLTRIEKDPPPSVDSHLLQEIALRFARNPEPLFSLPRRLDALVKFSLLNRECHDIVFDMALPELIARNVPKGETKAHSERVPPSFESLAAMSDGVIYQIKTMWIPMVDVISQKTKGMIERKVRENSNENNRWVAVQQLMDLVENPKKRWNLVPLHRELYAHRYMLITRAGAMINYQLSKPDLIKLSSRGYLRNTFSLDEVLDLALEVHGSMVAIERKIAIANADEEKRKIAKSTRADLRNQRVQSVVTEFEAAFASDAAFKGGSQDWNRLLWKHGDVGNAVRVFQMSRILPSSPKLEMLKRIAVDLAVSRMRDVLSRRRIIHPWPHCVYASHHFHLYFKEIEEAFDDVVWYGSEDQRDVELVNSTCNRWRIALQRFELEHLRSPEVVGAVQIANGTNGVRRRYLKKCLQFLRSGEVEHLDEAIEIAHAHPTA